MYIPLTAELYYRTKDHIAFRTVYPDGSRVIHIFEPYEDLDSRSRYIPIPEGDLPFLDLLGKALLNA